MKQQTESYLADFLPEIRIAAEAEVMIRPKDQTVREIIHQESAEADMVFLGLTIPPPDQREAYAARLQELAEPLRTVFFVKNSSLFVGKLIQTPEEVAAPGADAPDTSPEAAGA
jgi:hypothetical protein